MNLEKHLPMTETTYYILLSLLEPGHGYAVMQKAEELSGGRVRIAVGTMYGALDNLSRQKRIETVPSNDPRRKTYITTEEGRSVLRRGGKAYTYAACIPENRRRRESFVGSTGTYFTALFFQRRVSFRRRRTPKAKL